MSKNNYVGNLSLSTTVVARFPPFYAGVLLAILFSGINILPAQAKLGPISIESVYTTDANFKNNTVFVPGDRINYHVDVDNTTGSEFPINVRFQAFPIIGFNPSLYGYDQTVHLDKMPAGLSRFYNPTTLPSSDLIAYDYIVRISVTPSDCQGTGCENDGDWGEGRFTIQKTVPLPREPQGTALNLIVLVHGCCTDANDIKNEWDRLGNKIVQETIKNQPPGAWEIVVWDWSAYTPKSIIIDPQDLIKDARTAYDNIVNYNLDLRLADAIATYHYEHVHLIGHSAGAGLIDGAAKDLVRIYTQRNENPFIHLTFLDAFTPTPTDAGNYGFLPHYPDSKHYSEHYVDRTQPIIDPRTNEILPNAFNFDITGWPPDNSDERRDFGHQWPRYWYEKSVTSTQPKFKYGYPFSREGGNDPLNVLTNYPAGKRCFLTKIEDVCVPE
jgi:hypothetical protein